MSNAEEAAKEMTSHFQEAQGPGESTKEKRPDFLEYIEISISVFSLGLAAILVVAGVVLRYTVGYSHPAFDEITRYAIIWGMFAASSRLLRRHGHITIDVLLINLPTRWQAILRTLAMVAGSFLGVILVWYGAKLVIQSYDLAAVSQSSLRVPMWLPQLAVPFGGLLLLVRFLQALVKQAQNIIRDAAEDSKPHTKRPQ